MGSETEKIQQVVDLFLEQVQDEDRLGEMPRCLPSSNTTFQQVAQIWQGQAFDLSSRSGELSPESGFQDLPKTIGPYSIEKVVGHGGFGTVFLGKDPRTSQIVAVE